MIKHQDTRQEEKSRMVILQSNITGVNDMSAKQNVVKKMLAWKRSTPPKVNQDVS